MKFLHPLLTFIFHLNYLGPLVMGVLDSSFLVLPFGNDLVVVGLVASHRHNIWVYVLTAALGSTIGAGALSLIAKKLGEERIHKMMGDKRFSRLRRWINDHGALSIAAGALAPPPFPYTVVIAAAGALGYPISRLLGVNFLARAARFTLLAWLALKFGKQVLAISKSTPFLWTMAIFLIICLGATAFSLWNWFGKSKSPQPA